MSLASQMVYCVYLPDCRTKHYNFYTTSRCLFTDYSGDSPLPSIALAMYIVLLHVGQAGAGDWCHCFHVRASAVRW